MPDKSKDNNENVLNDLFVFPEEIELIENWDPTEQEKQALTLYDNELNLLVDSLTHHVEGVLIELEHLEEAPTEGDDKQTQNFNAIARKETDLNASLKHLLMVLTKRRYLHKNLLVTCGQTKQMDHNIKKFKRVLSASEIDTAKIENDETAQQKEANEDKSFMPAGSSSQFRRLFVEVNWWRLFLIRIRRVGDALTLIANTPMGSPEINKALSYLGWIFYVPRILVNLYLFTQHVFFPLTKEEKGLPMSLRLKVQLWRRWAELANDIVWLVVGLINCFILTGLSALGLTAGLYFFDILVAGLRYAFEMKKQNRIREAILHRLEVEEISDIEKLRLEQLLEIMNNNMLEKKQMLKLSLATASMLAGSTVVFFISACGFSWLAPIAAVTILFTCIISKLVLEPLYKKERPINDILWNASLLSIGASIIAIGIFMATGILATTAISAPYVIAAGVSIVIAASIGSYFLTKPIEDNKKMDNAAKLKKFNAIVERYEDRSKEKIHKSTSTMFFQRDLESPFKVSKPSLLRASSLPTDLDYTGEDNHPGQP